jgi:hypothetical protein
VAGSPNVNITGSDMLPIDTWMTLCAVFRPGQSIEMYLDDDLIASDTTSETAVNSTSYPLWFGNQHWFGSTWHPLNGEIDFVRIHAIPEPAGVGLVVSMIVLSPRSRRS